MSVGVHVLFPNHCVRATPVHVVMKALNLYIP